MGFIISIIRKLLKLTLYFFVFATIVVVIPNLPPYTSFSSIDVDQKQPLPAHLELKNAQKLYENKLLGPEAYELWNGEVYTSLATGEIVKLSPGGHVTFVTKIGKPCAGLIQEHICGRPLGFKIDDRNKQMYVADAYLGIWKVNLKTDQKQLLVSPDVEIEGKNPKLINSVALLDNGDFVWTHSNTDYDLKDLSYCLLGDPTGRLLYYNAAKNESTVLIDKLWFANGVVLSPDKKFAVVAETLRGRLLKYHLEGSKKGKTEVFLQGIRGMFDNLRELPDGSGVLAAMYTVYEDHEPVITDSMAKTPLVRKFIARVFRGVEILFEYLHSFYPHIIFEEIIYKIGHATSLSGFVVPRSGLLYVDWNGKIVETYLNTDKSLSHISDGIVVNDKLYTGCPHAQDFVGVFPAPPLLKKAFAPIQSAPPPQKTAGTVTKEIPKTQTKSDSPPSKAKVDKSTQPKTTTAKPPTTIPTENKPTPKPVQESSQKPKVQQSTPKPVEQPKTKTDEQQKLTPVEQPKSKPAEQSKPKPAEQSKPKPAEQSKPKPAEQSKPKPAEQSKPKPAEQPKPKPAKQSTPKPAEQPKQKPAEQKKTTTDSQKTTNDQNKPTTPKPVESKTSEAPPKAQSATEKPKAAKVKPIIEEIPSDTAKPSKEKLKVIKKEGPTEIPNPNV